MQKMLISMHDSYKGSLCKGIFWLVDDCLVFAKILVYSDGAIIEKESLKLNSKNADNYNHRLTWDTFPARITKGKPFDHYPRGRVEIRRNKAIIYANPNICSDKYLEMIRKEFCLDERHGIIKVRCMPDYSNHYRCYLDKQNVVYRANEEVIHWAR